MNRSLQLFCPEKPRDFTGKRWLKITLRTLHLLGIAGVSGGILFDVAVSNWQEYLHLTLFSGMALLLLEIWSNAIFLIQLRGLIILIKLLLLSLFYTYPQYDSIILIVIALSSIVSHAPGNFRYFSLLHGRRIDALG